MIDDMAALREAFDKEEPPSADSRGRARAKLMARIASAEAAPAVSTTPVRAAKQRRRGWGSLGWGWRSGIATVAAAAVAGGFVIAGGLGGPDQSSVTPSNASSSIPAIELAANYALAQPFTAPQPDQWTYLELRITRPGTIASSKGQTTDETTQSWMRADGQQTAGIDNGQLAVTPENAGPLLGFPPADYASLAALPSDPGELLDWMGQQLDTIGIDSSQQDETMFNGISSILCDDLLPPEITASLLRALAMIPGVSQAPDLTEIDGHPAIAIGRVQEGWLRADILLDPQTHEFLGSQEIAVADHTETGTEGAQGGGTAGGPGAQPSGGGEPQPVNAQVAKGEIQSIVIRSEIRIVDAPGQTS